MRNEIFSYLKIAAKVAQRGQKRSFFLGSVGVRKDGRIMTSYNGPTRLPTKQAHSEFRLTKKLDYGATVYIARVLQKTGDYAMARPCRICLNAMIAKKVKKIFYTIGPNEFGFIDLVNGTENGEEME